MIHRRLPRRTSGTFIIKEVVAESLEDCLGRSKTDLGSSKNYPDSQDLWILFLGSERESQDVELDKGVSEIL